LSSRIPVSKLSQGWLPSSHHFGLNQTSFWHHLSLSFQLFKSVINVQWPCKILVLSQSPSMMSMETSHWENLAFCCLLCKVVFKHSCVKAFPRMAPFFSSFKFQPKLFPMASVSFFPIVSFQKHDKGVIALQDIVLSQSPAIMSMETSCWENFAFCGLFGKVVLKDSSVKAFPWMTPFFSSFWFQPNLFLMASVSFFQIVSFQKYDKGVMALQYICSFPITFFYINGNKSLRELLLWYIFLLLEHCIPHNLYQIHVGYDQMVCGKITMDWLLKPFCKCFHLCHFAWEKVMECLRKMDNYVDSMKFTESMFVLQVLLSILCIHC